VQEVAYADGQRDEREKWEANGPYFTSVVHACCEERERIRKAVEALMETAHWRLLTREEAEAAVLAVIDGEAP
jgi:NCAIR mutase (PurE)-related protein